MPEDTAHLWQPVTLMATALPHPNSTPSTRLTTCLLHDEASEPPAQHCFAGATSPGWAGLSLQRQDSSTSGPPPPATPTRPWASGLTAFPVDLHLCLAWKPELVAPGPALLKQACAVLSPLSTWAGAATQTGPHGAGAGTLSQPPPRVPSAQWRPPHHVRPQRTSGQTGLGCADSRSCPQPALPRCPDDTHAGLNTCDQPQQQRPTPRLPLRTCFPQRPIESF